MTASLHELNPEQKRRLDDFRSTMTENVSPGLMTVVDAASLDIRNTLESMGLPIEDEYMLFAVTVAGITIATNMRKSIEAGKDPQHAQHDQLMGLAGLGVKIDDRRVFGPIL